MSLASHEIKPGLKVSHAELGDGVVVSREPTGFFPYSSVPLVNARFQPNLYIFPQTDLIPLLEDLQPLHQNVLNPCGLQWRLKKFL